MPDLVVSRTNFADDLLNKRSRLESSRSRYRSTIYVSASSNVCERLFSNARIKMTHLRSSMYPRCEILLFLNQVQLIGVFGRILGLLMKSVIKVMQTQRKMMEISSLRAKVAKKRSV